MRLVPYIYRSEVPSRSYPDLGGAFEEFFEDFFKPADAPDAPARRHWIPAADIVERQGNLILRVQVPGVDEKNIELKLDGDTLTVRGERKLDTQDEGTKYHRIESHHGVFSRSFRLSDTVDRDQITADYRNGVLTVTLPQKPEARPREIPVKVQ